MDNCSTLCPTTRTNVPRCGTLRGKMFPVVGHNVEQLSALCPTTWNIDPRCGTQRGKHVFLEYLPQVAKEIKIILNYHSVGPKRDFDEKNVGQKSRDTVPLTESTRT